MEKYEVAVEQFIEKRGYLSNPDVLGIVLYGSYTTGYQDAQSDIDMHIIMSNNVQDIYRNEEKCNGFKIEYFEKPLHDLYESANNDFLMQENALLAIIGQGVILFDRCGEVKKLQAYVLKKYSVPLPPLDKDDAKEAAVIIYNRIIQLQKIYDRKQIDFHYQYCLLVEKIRKFYSKKCGCPSIPVAKVLRIYTDEEYRKSVYKAKIPDAKFIELYLKALTCQSDKEKLDCIYELYDYTTQSLKIDPENYRIKIKSRNDPFNRIHE